MSKEVKEQTEQRNDIALNVWNDQTRVKEIKKIFAPDLNEGEFRTFMEMGHALGANPFLNEIYAQKYKDRCSIFLGRDFYRRKAQEQSDYDGHFADAVFQKDRFKVVHGEPQHEYSSGERGKCLGAYCLVYRKKISRPFYIWVDVGEYNTGKFVWSQKPATMIKKVAEAQALRMAFQGVFAGTYSEEEDWHDAQVVEENTAKTGKNGKNLPKNGQKQEQNEAKAWKLTKKWEDKLMELVDNDFFSPDEIQKSLKSLRNAGTKEKAEKVLYNAKEEYERRLDLQDQQTTEAQYSELPD